MQPADYSFRFNDFLDGPSRVYMAENHTGVSRELFVSIDDTQLPRLACRQLPSLYADMIDLAVAVHFADRFAIGRGDLPRQLHLQIPIRHRELFERQVVVDKLRDILFWYTNDQWDFVFTSRQATGRMSEIQRCLNLGGGRQHTTEVALWSSGLDSLAGLLNRIKSETAEHYLLFGSGSNSQIHARQRELATRIPSHQSQYLSCTQVIYRYIATHTPRNENQRTRGFVFMLLGAVCALLADQQLLHIYENGVGAINLPFRASEVGLDHTRAVHPISLFEMSDTVSRITQASFRFVNPFVYSTKAKMCLVLDNALYRSLIAQTISCDSRHHDVPSQCGYCSSCPLRKQSLLAAGISDDTAYVIPSTRENRPYRQSTGNHLRAMLWQVRVLRQILSTEIPWDSLTRYYPRLMDIIDRTAASECLSPEAMQEQFVILYRRYVEEWEQVQSEIERGLLGEEELRAAA